MYGYKMGLENTLKRRVRIRQEESDIEESFEGKSSNLESDSEIGTKGGLCDEEGTVFYHALTTVAP